MISPNNTANDIINKLRNDGYRITKVRSSVLGIFDSSDAPLSAYDVTKELHKQCLEVNKTTVYRELSFLISEKILIELFLRNGISHYELASLPHHHHLVCTDCGSVGEVNCKEIEQSMNEVNKEALKKGFVINNHKLEFFGVCASCVF